MEFLEPALDGEAIEELYGRLERPLFNVAYRYLWVVDDAHDVVQDAFVRLWRMRDRVRMDSVEPLLYRIAINLAKSRLRSRRLWRWVSLGVIWDHVSPGPGPERRLEQAEGETRLREAIQELPEDLREVILLCELSELGYDQVAQVLGIPPGTVGSRRYRALRLLRATLGEEKNHE